MNKDVEATYNKLSPKQQTFIETYPQYRSITLTAKAVGIHRDTVYKWREGDDNFLRILQAIKKETDEETLEKVEAELYDRAMGNKPAKMSDILLMFLAKALAPEKYREKAPETRLIGDITVKLAVPAYTDNTVLLGPRNQLKEGDTAVNKVV